MLANIGAYVSASLTGTQSAEEHRQASLFVDVFRHAAGPAARSSPAAARRRSTSIPSMA